MPAHVLEVVERRRIGKHSGDSKLVVGIPAVAVVAAGGVKPVNSRGKLHRIPVGRQVGDEACLAGLRQKQPPVGGDAQSLVSAGGCGQRTDQPRGIDSVPAHPHADHVFPDRRRVHDLQRAVDVARIDRRKLRVRAIERIRTGVDRVPVRKDDARQLGRVRERARAERRDAALEADRFEIGCAGEGAGGDFRDVRIEHEEPDAPQRIGRAGRVPPLLENGGRKRAGLLRAEAHRGPVSRGEPEHIDDSHDHRTAHFPTSNSPLLFLPKHQAQNSSDSHMTSHHQACSPFE